MSFLEQMGTAGVKPNAFTFRVVRNALVKVGRGREASSFLAAVKRMRRNGIQIVDMDTNG